MTVDIPAPLLEKVRNQEVVLFLGAGASVGATHPHGHPVPLGDRLRDLLCDRFLGGALKKKSLAEVTDFAMNESDFGADNLLSVICFRRLAQLTTISLYRNFVGIAS
jgi:hypothetical protein